MATKVVCFSHLLKCFRSLYGKQCGPRSDCSCSGSTLFASIHNSSVMLGNYLQQTTFSDAFFLLALKPFSCQLQLLQGCSYQIGKNTFAYTNESKNMGFWGFLIDTYKIFWEAILICLIPILVEIISLWENLSSGFPTKWDSNRSPQLQRQARKVKFHS